MEETSIESAPSLEPDPVPNRSRLIIGGVAALAAVILAAFLLGTRHVAKVEKRPGFSVDGDRVAIEGGAPAWNYVDLAQAALGNPIPPKPVPGRVAVDEARAEQVMAPLPGRVETVSARLGQRLVKGERLAAIRSTALVDLAKEIDQLRRDEAAKAQTAQRVRSDRKSVV